MNKVDFEGSPCLLRVKTSEADQDTASAREREGIGE
jgi:hypothetical protein